MIGSRMARLFIALALLSRLSFGVDEKALRADASIYPAPEYPVICAQANHSGRVIVEVVVAPITKTSPLARVQSAKIMETPDPSLANAVLVALQDARYMPFFDEHGVTKATGRVVWDFRIVSGRPEVIDPYAPPRAEETQEQLAADDLRIARRARQILSSEAVWNRADNRQCPPNAKTVSLYCALERATTETTGTFDHRGNVMEDARAAMDEINPQHPDYHHWLMDYNNDAKTSFADIQKVLKATEARIARRIGH